MSLTFGLLVFPGVTQLDLTGPFEVVHRVLGAKVHVLWKTLDPVHADSGLGLLPTTTFADCPPLDVLLVPGGAGQVPLMADAVALNKTDHLTLETAETKGSTDEARGKMELIDGFLWCHDSRVEILEQGQLPIRYCAYTPCFRRP